MVKLMRSTHKETPKLQKKVIPFLKTTDNRLSPINDIRSEITLGLTVKNIDSCGMIAAAVNM